MNAISKLLYLLLIVGTIYWSLSALKPNISTAEKLERTTSFSTENALSQLKNITKETHYPGTKAHKNVQNYIVNELEKLGLQTQIQSSLLSADTITKTTTPSNIAKASMKSKKAKRASDDDPSGYDDLV